MLNQWIYTVIFTGIISVSGSSTTTSRNIEDENVPLVLSEAVQGSIGRLPCNVTAPIVDDKVALVIWYKDGYVTPIYSFDVRHSQFEKGKHWVDENTFGGRAFFQAAAQPASLTIDSTKSSDSGTYRCRVDFNKSPTRNARVQLKVIIPPEKLLMLDEKGAHIPHYILGPYNEGASVNITCVSIGGRPLPNVSWWHENTLLKSHSVMLSDKRVKNVLQLEKLQRSHLHMVLTCQASNNNVTTPISSSVTLDLNLRPLRVKLVGENRPLSADNTFELWCEVAGAKPAPTITWWKGSMPMRNTRELTTPDGNITTSILSFTPTIDDGGKYLSCRAEQPLIMESGIEHGWKLDIYHIPIVKLEYGTNLNATPIREGADVYFECNIKSNPWVYRVSWRHNAKILDNNVAEGIVVANQSLVLQNVSRARGGIYTCVGSNSEGDGESNPVTLDIKFPPICRPGQQESFSAARSELVKVPCEVEANPDNVHFTWKFNSTQFDFLDIPTSVIAFDHARSVAHYLPRTEHDYGTLLCWGSNEIGAQTDPCIFHIIPAGPPDPPSNCTVLNITYDMIQVECIEGFNGGLQQSFFAEVYSSEARQLVTTTKSRTIPYFEIRGLQSGIEFILLFAATNAKGTSKSTRVNAYTLKNPEKQTDLALGAPVIEDMKPFLAILLGVVGGLVFIAFVIVFIVRLRGSSGRDHNNCTSHLAPSLSTTTTTMRNSTHPSQMDGLDAGRDSLRDSLESMEKNPDIIPQGPQPSLTDRDDEEKGFEWINNVHPRLYATAALAEQNGLNSLGSYERMVTYQALPGQNFLPPTSYSTLRPVVTSMAQQGISSLQSDLTYADLSLVGPKRQPYTTATLGRPRQMDFKRHQEPTIYAQIDLARNPSYSHRGVFGGGTNTISRLPPTTVMSHPSQMTTFPPPAPFANKTLVTTNNMTDGLCSNNAINPTRRGCQEGEMLKTTTLDRSSAISSPSPDDGSSNYTTRF
ncbi:nephrin-like [Phlebotomus argentipes]|uniref:nephrin-like n=1 Tax=Phlebotomus argentipes TaxID=94469 RepID=UPI002892BF20|nr:nephrin-like [Phlebotomus argentipes]